MLKLPLGKNMPVNQSDLEFFKKALSIMQEQLTLKPNASSLSDTIEIFKQFRPFLSSKPLLPYQSLSITSKKNVCNQARFIAKGNTKKPLVIFFPGTAFMFPLFDENYSFFSRLIKHTDCHGLMLEYRLSPKYPFPCPHEDAKSLIDYVNTHQKDLHIDTKRIIIAGYIPLSFHNACF